MLNIVQLNLEDTIIFVIKFEFELLPFVLAHSKPNVLGRVIIFYIIYKKIALLS